MSAANGFHQLATVFRLKEVAPGVLSRAEAGWTTEQDAGEPGRFKEHSQHHLELLLTEVENHQAAQNDRLLSRALSYAILRPCLRSLWAAIYHQSAPDVRSIDEDEDEPDRASLLFDQVQAFKDNYTSYECIGHCAVRPSCDAPLSLSLRRAVPDAARRCPGACVAQGGSTRQGSATYVDLPDEGGEVLRPRTAPEPRMQEGQ